MDNTQLKIWNNLLSFQLDDPESDFAFSDRLERENGWDLFYCHRVIEEYKN